MLFIAHRGNINGRWESMENHPYNIMKLAERGINCEVDIWYDGINFLLGHDEPIHVVTSDFFRYKDALWFHAKNLEALSKLQSMGLKCFWHEEDKYTLTSNGYIWTYPDQPVCENSIIVDLSPDWMNKNYWCHGVCGDYMA